MKKPLSAFACLAALSLPLAAIAQVPPPPPAPMPAPKVLTRVDPIYPHAARCRNIGGSVRALLNIDASGSVTAATVAASSGMRDLDRSAVLALRRWTFESTGSPYSGYLVVNFEPPGSVSSCLDYWVQGGHVGLSPDFVPGTLLVRVTHFPAESQTLDLLITDDAGAVVDRIDQARLPRNGAPYWEGRFSGLKPGRYLLKLVSGTQVHATAPILVSENGSVSSSTPPPAPPPPKA